MSCVAALCLAASVVRAHGDALGATTAATGRAAGADWTVFDACDRLLEPPVEGGLYVYVEMEELAPSAEDRRAAMEHFLSTRELCRMRYGERTDIVEVTTGELPTSLHNAVERDDRSVVHQHLAFLPGGFDSYAFGRSEHGTHCELRSLRGKELAVRSRHGDGVTPEWLFRCTEPKQAYAYYLVNAHRARAQLRALRELGVTQRAVWSGAGRRTLLIDLRVPDLPAVFEESSPANGLMATPGHAEVVWAETGDERTLIATYFDCVGAQLVTELVEWRKGGRFPTRLQTTWWMAGAGKPYQVTTSLCEERQALDLSSVREALEHGEIVDRRFGATIRYPAGEGPATVRDDVDAILALAGVRVPVDDSPRVGPLEEAPKRIDPSAPVTRALLPEWTVKALDAAPVGRSRRATCRLRNAGETTLYLEDVSSSCTVARHRLSGRTLPPGGEASLELTLGVFALREQEYLTRVEYSDLSSGASGELTLAVELVGEPAFELTPRYRCIREDDPRDSYEWGAELWVDDVDGQLDALELRLGGVPVPREDLSIARREGTPTGITIGFPADAVPRGSGRGAQLVDVELASRRGDAAPAEGLLVVDRPSCGDDSDADGNCGSVRTIWGGETLELDVAGVATGDGDLRLLALDGGDLPVDARLETDGDRRTVVATARRRREGELQPRVVSCQLDGDGRTTTFLLLWVPEGP